MALICANCHVHNGMALMEEYDYMSYFCYLCNHFNPSKIMRSVPNHGRPSLPVRPFGDRNGLFDVTPRRESPNPEETLENEEVGRRKSFKVDFSHLIRILIR